jgi:Protein of unknown function (DUF1153)
VIRRKAEVVSAVLGGLLSLEEACSRYLLTVEEFLAWQRSIDRHGLAGLRTTRIQQYRPVVPDPPLGSSSPMSRGAERGGGPSSKKRVNASQRLRLSRFAGLTVLRDPPALLARPSVQLDDG